MATPFEQQVLAHLAAIEGGQTVLPGDPAPIDPWPVPRDAPCCLICSPHPDDESLVGGAALRLRHDHAWRVVNLAVTLGSRVSRRSERWQEGQRCCEFLGFELLSPVGQAGHALERIHPATALHDPPLWEEAVERLVAVMLKLRPRVVLAPHALDGHAAHIGTHQLVRDALHRLPPDMNLHVLWSEYWNTQLEPRLMLALSPSRVAQLMTATALHAGEVQRNPYHLSLPAWLIDGARRGVERVGPPGSAATGVRMAALYGWQRWSAGVAHDMPASVVGEADDLGALFADEA